MKNWRNSTALMMRLFLAICVLPQLSFGKDLPLGRPKIGLVLSGGGALGFAHIGVLKVLREKRVPVDIVTGTSMGAIVGAALASGRTIEEMEEVIYTDWDDLFTENEPRSELPYHLKPGRNRELVGSGKISFQEGKLATPEGFIQGQHVLTLFQKLFRGIPNPVNFDQLAVPFRAVCADIETGEAVIFSSGHLPSVVRASMSVPGVFAPVEMQGRFLVDGGIVNNLPVDVALGLGADLLIVVDLNVDFKKRSELRSPLSVTGQMVSLLINQNSSRQLKNVRSKDLVISVDLSGHSSTNFKEGQAMMEIGEQTARSFVEQLEPFSVSSEEYQRYEAERTTPLTIEETIAFIKLENDSSVDDLMILKILDLQKGDPLNRQHIEERVRSVYNYGHFSEVTYQVIREEEQVGLLIKTTEKPWLGEFFRIGAAFEDDFDGNSYYRLAVSYRNTSLTSQGSYIEVDAEIGKNPFLEAELFQPWGNSSPYFIEPKIDIGRSDIFMRSGNEIIAEYHRTTGGGGLRVGRTLGKNAEISAQVVRGFGKFARDIGNAALPEFSYDLGEVDALFVYDSLDAIDFPKEGFLLRLSQHSSFEELGASDDFSDLTGRFAWPITGGRNTVILTGDFGMTFDERPVERSFTFGGFLDLSGVQNNSFLASDYGIGRLITYRRFSEVHSPFFGMGFYLGGSVEMAVLRSDIAVVEDQDQILAGSLFLGIDTPLLPLYLGLGATDQDDFSFYLALGRIGSWRRE